MLLLGLDQAPAQEDVVHLVGMDQGRATTTLLAQGLADGDGLAEGDVAAVVAVDEAGQEVLDPQVRAGRPILQNRRDPLRMSV
jgi:hypothetical protein